ncbi:MAG: cyclic nucleotide-binding domain-containing protein [Deltaproteobacteria bacterium]|nr:cyclic nucleotide-binding domain-containing protein [Deltaproteobacteria bacterium]
MLVYQDHFSRGLFVVTRGSLRVCQQGKDAAQPSELIESAGDGPLVVPSLLDLDQPAKATIETHTDVELFYIPRSVALGAGAQLSWLEAGTRRAAGA